MKPKKISKNQIARNEARKRDGYICQITGKQHFPAAGITIVGGHLIPCRVYYPRYDSGDKKNVVSMTWSLHTDFDKQNTIEKKIIWLREKAIEYSRPSLDSWADRLEWLTDLTIEQEPDLPEIIGRAY